MMKAVSVAFMVLSMSLAEALKLQQREDDGSATDPKQGLSQKIWFEATKVSANVDWGSSESNAACNDIQKPGKGEYNLWKPNGKYFSQIGQDKRLEALLPSTGFFIESGAADGETNSNTLAYERKGWSGLLVEPNPQTFGTLLTKQRKAYSYNGALSITGDFGTMTLQTRDCAGYKGDGECSQLVGFNKQPIKYQVKLAPLESLLGCLNRTTVDFWSLDVEGVEGKIVQTFPFQKIEVGVMLIEMNKDTANNERIMKALSANGFKVCGVTDLDRIFVNPAYYKKRGLQTPKEC